MALIDNLASYWKLDETSGSRVDSHGSNNLTDNNTVTYDTGKIGNAAQFTSANVETLKITDGASNPDLSIGTGDFSVAGWIYFDAVTNYRSMVTKYDNSNGNREYWLFMHNDGSTVDMKWRVLDATVNNNEVKSTNIGDLVVDTWYFVYAYVDQTANEIGISVNDGTVSTETLTITTHNGTGVFGMGGQNLASDTPAQLLDGRIDEVYIANKVLSAQEVTDLYNSGAGFAYPFTAASTFIPKIMIF